MPWIIAGTLNCMDFDTWIACLLFSGGAMRMKVIIGIVRSEAEEDGLIDVEYGV